MTTLRGIAQPSDCFLTHMLLAYWRKLLVAFPLVISGVFDDPTQVLAILSALFGTIVGLVGTYFGVKASSDAREGAQDQATAATAQAVQQAAGGQQAGGGQQAAGGQQAGGGRGWRRLLGR
jgi:type IV secretory pathway VirB6-like protein